MTQLKRFNLLVDISILGNRMVVLLCFSEQPSSEFLESCRAKYPNRLRSVGNIENIAAEEPTFNRRVASALNKLGKDWIGYIVVSDLERDVIADVSNNTCSVMVIDDLRGKSRPR